MEDVLATALSHKPRPREAKVGGTVQLFVQHDAESSLRLSELLPGIYIVHVILNARLDHVVI